MNLQLEQEMKRIMDNLEKDKKRELVERRREHDHQRDLRQLEQQYGLTHD